MSSCLNHQHRWTMTSLTFGWMNLLVCHVGRSIAPWSSSDTTSWLVYPSSGSLDDMVGSPIYTSCLEQLEMGLRGWQSQKQRRQKSNRPNWQQSQSQCNGGVLHPIISLKLSFMYLMNLHNIITGVHWVCGPQWIFLFGYTYYVCARDKNNTWLCICSQL